MMTGEAAPPARTVASGYDIGRRKRESAGASARGEEYSSAMAVAKDAIDRLLRAAARVRARAYAPYSGFHVGAAVLAEGRVYAATNVENSSFPLSVCAERNAVAAAIAGGARRIDAIAIVGGDSRPTPPCGGCRQVLAEFASAAAPVTYATQGGKRVTTTIGELLPRAFGASDLRAAERGSRGSRIRRGSRPARAPGRSRPTRR
jgi:cytidine deaminase